MKPATQHEFDCLRLIAQFTETHFLVTHLSVCEMS